MDRIDAYPPAAVRDAFETAQTIGRLEGLLTNVPADTGDQFYARSIVTALIAGLGASGSPVDREAIGRWIAAAGAPPRADQPDRVDPSALVSVMLLELRQTSGPLGGAARQLVRAAPHLVQPFDGADVTTLGTALEQARNLMQAPSPPRGALLPLIRLCEAAAQNALFVDGEHAMELIEGSVGSMPVTRAGGVGHVWALGLMMPPFLREIELTHMIVPIFGGIGRRAVSRTHNADLRHRWIIEDLGRAAGVALEDLREAYRLSALCRERLEARRHSRAWAAWSLIAGFGQLRRGQLAKALETTPAGIDHVLAPLLDAGLIERAEGDKRGPFHAVTRPPPMGAPVALDTLSSIDEFDAAMMDLDRLLAKTMPG